MRPVFGDNAIGLTRIRADPHRELVFDRHQDKDTYPDPDDPKDPGTVRGQHQGADDDQPNRETAAFDDLVNEDRRNITHRISFGCGDKSGLGDDHVRVLVEGDLGFSCCFHDLKVGTGTIHFFTGFRKASDHFPVLAVGHQLLVIGTAQGLPDHIQPFFHAAETGRADAHLLQVVGDIFL